MEGTKKYVNKIEDLVIMAAGSDDKYGECDNATEFELPPIAPNTDELSGYAGLPGTVVIPDWSNAASPELTLKFSRIPANGKKLLNPSGTKVKIVWSESVVDVNGNSTDEVFIVYAAGTPTEIPGGGKKKGERPEVEVKIACTKYKYSSTSETIVNYDPLNGKVEIYGTNYAAGAAGSLASY